MLWLQAYVQKQLDSLEITKATFSKPSSMSARKVLSAIILGQGGGGGSMMFLSHEKAMSYVLCIPNGAENVHFKWN